MGSELYTMSMKTTRCKGHLIHEPFTIQLWQVYPYLIKSVKSIKQKWCYQIRKYYWK